MLSNSTQSTINMWKFSVIFVGLFMGPNCLQAGSEIPVWTGPSFRATQSEYDVKAPHEARKSTVYISKYGMKMISGAVGGPRGSEGTSTIFIAKEKEGYLIIPELKMYIDPENSEGTIVEDDKATGIFARVPCEHFKHSQSLGLVMLKQRATEKWRCSNQVGASDLIQYMDKELKCVIRTESGGGQIIELSQITLENFPKDFFDIPKGYRKGTMRELFQNPSTLPSYSPSIQSPEAPP